MNYCYVEIPNDNNKILKYNHGERVIKSSVYDSCRLRMFSRKNAFLSKQPWKILHRKKKLSMHLLVTHRFQIVRLMKKENKLDCYKGEDYTMKSKTIVITPKNLQ